MNRYRLALDIFYFHDSYWLNGALNSWMGTLMLLLFFLLLLHSDKRPQHTEHPVSLENDMLWGKEQRSALHYGMNKATGKTGLYKLMTTSPKIIVWRLQQQNPTPVSIQQNVFLFDISGRSHHFFTLYYFRYQRGAFYSHVETVCKTFFAHFL